MSGQWTHGDTAATASAAQTKKPEGVEVADLSGTRGLNVASDAAPAGNDLPIEDAAYQGEFHDALRDQFAEELAKAGNTVLKEVPLTLQSDPPVTAIADIMLRNPLGEVYAIEVKTGDDPQFTPAQRIVYPHVELGDLVASSDPRISALAFTRDVVLPAIHVVVLYARGPGEPMTAFGLWRFMQE